MTINFLANHPNKESIITAIDASVRFPEILEFQKGIYKEDIELFKNLTNQSSSSAELLDKIRNKGIAGDVRMSLLKIFRRCVSPVLDTEMAKKITKVKTEQLVESLGHTFKDINLLKQQMASINSEEESALAVLIGEYDTRGQLGYQLTDRFFNWFEDEMSDQFTIEGPRGAGRDVELSTIFSDFEGNYPCDFVIREKLSNRVCAVGFARYDSTRGGAQSDDRTGGNTNKVTKAISYCVTSKNNFRMIFLSDGPGLLHKDTWEESCILEALWDGNVRVTTLKTLQERITPSWLLVS